MTPEVILQRRLRIKAGGTISLTLFDLDASYQIAKKIRSIGFKLIKLSRCIWLNRIFYKYSNATIQQYRYYSRSYQGVA
jgi:hypothetical protein